MSRDLAAGLYEICSYCAGECGGCVHCWDSGLLLHRCSEDPTPDDPPVEDESEHA